jgi:hypothetical protein
MQKPAGFRRFVQYAMPGFTVCASLCTSFRHPDYGQLIGLVAQIFWGYTGWVAWRERGEKGILINTLIIGGVLCVGVTNYWILGARKGL